jgi:hypothetical protein
VVKATFFITFYNSEMNNLITKLLLGVLICLGTYSAKAQFVTRIRDSVVNATAKTLTFGSTFDNVKSFYISYLRSTGTTSGYAVLEQRADTVYGSSTNAWVPVKGMKGIPDTCTLVNDALPRHFIWEIPIQAGNGYRVRFVPSGTQKVYVTFGQFRRTGG